MQVFVLQVSDVSAPPVQPAGDSGWTDETMCSGIAKAEYCLL
jgi:hypothetical protein